MREKLSVRNLRRVLRDPSYIRGAVSELGVVLNTEIHRRLYTNSGTSVMDEQWDNLILIDGCRYDIFAESNTIDGRLEQRTSRASQSWEFMTEYFVGETHHDTVYVSANPYTSRLDDGTFHAIVELYDDGWDEDDETVLPETVVAAAKAAHEEYPHKRLVVHFMQPHIPFIGQKGQALQHTGLAHDDFDSTDDEGNIRYPVWGNLRYGFTEITEVEVWEAYRENLDVVLPYVKELVDTFEGTSVVTSDHGNLIGDRLRPIPVKGYGHPAGIRAPGLIEVPWLVVENGQRTVRSDDPQSRDETDEETVEDRLRALGYT